jgi:hypothetical protein
VDPSPPAATGHGTGSPGRIPARRHPPAGSPTRSGGSQNHRPPVDKQPFFIETNREGDALVSGSLSQCATCGSDVDISRDACSSSTAAASVLSRRQLPLARSGSRDRSLARRGRARTAGAPVSFGRRIGRRPPARLIARVRITRSPWQVHRSRSSRLLRADAIRPCAARSCRASPHTGQWRVGR